MNSSSPPRTGFIRSTTNSASRNIQWTIFAFFLTFAHSYRSVSCFPYACAYFGFNFNVNTRSVNSFRYCTHLCALHLFSTVRRTKRVSNRTLYARKHIRMRYMILYDCLVSRYVLHQRRRQRIEWERPYPQSTGMEHTHARLMDLR